MILLKAFYFLLLSFGLHADSIPEQENGSLVLEHFTQRITNIAERCIPAVVKVAALRTANNSSMDLRDRVFFGSGCLVSSEGHIVTCNHVIKDAVCFSVYFESQEIEARLIQVIPEIDIAILKIDGRNLPYLELGDSDSLSIGEWVISSKCS